MSGGSRVSASDYLFVLSLVLAIVVLVGVGMIFARRQSVGRILLWGAPVQLLCSLAGVLLSHSWLDSVAFGVMTVLAVVLWLPAVSAKTPPPVGYGMPYGAPVPGMPQYPPQYGAPGMPQPVPAATSAAVSAAADAGTMASAGPAAPGVAGPVITAPRNAAAGR
ncbi:hypothetical protein [Amycolatopsis sp. NPDC004079]|uniref:hypothetical protein n=1 Tax=Amycolatopsis sp. NPDC004079 TaxID=3154549 RepID=UPI00339F3626